MEYMHIVIKSIEISINIGSCHEFNTNFYFNPQIIIKGNLELWNETRNINISFSKLKRKIIIHWLYFLREMSVQSYFKLSSVSTI